MYKVLSYEGTSVLCRRLDHTLRKYGSTKVLPEVRKYEIKYFRKYNFTCTCTTTVQYVYFRTKYFFVRTRKLYYLRTTNVSCTCTEVQLRKYFRTK